MSRKYARVLAFQALYAWDVGASKEEDLFSFSWVNDSKYNDSKHNNDNNNKTDEATLTFARLLIKGTIENIKEIDTIIREHLISTWTMERLNRVSLAILRISVYSLLFQKDISFSIIIDQAINIIKEYGESNSYKFVNGILNAIKDDLLKPANECNDTAV